MAKKILSVGLALIFVGMLAACGQQETPVTETTAMETIVEATEAAEVTQAPAEQEETVSELQDADFGKLEALLGLGDEEAADYFGVSAENWTEDQSTFIGRIYQVSLFDQSVKVFTSYSEENEVVSVSAWITDGTQEVTEDQVALWEQRLTEYAGSEPSFDNTSSEGGSQNWKWKKDNTFITLRWLGDIVTIAMLPAVGELK